jgi:hypothetical protein
LEEATRKALFGESPLPQLGTVPEFDTPEFDTPEFDVDANDLLARKSEGPRVAAKGVPTS